MENKNKDLFELVRTFSRIGEEVSTDTKLDQEYTVEQLAVSAKTSVRNIRNYQEKGLLAPPRLQGRKGFYSNQHLSRLKLITGMIERGYGVNAIRELLTALEAGITCN